MSENNPNLPPKLRSAMDANYDAPQPDPAFVAGLEERLRQRHGALFSAVSPHNNPRRTFMQTLRARPVFALLAALLALLLLTGITYAVGRATGFIPGIGFVRDARAVLETPVVVEREIASTSTATGGASSTSAGASSTQPPPVADPVAVEQRQGITITVEQAVAGADQLVILYRVTGLPPDLFSTERMETQQAYAAAHPDESFWARVRLPDGSIRDQVSGGGCQGASDGKSTWQSCRLVYAPLPERTTQFTLEISHFEGALPGELPEDWVIPVQLSPVPAAQNAGGLQEVNISSETVNGITLRLAQVDQSTQHTAFQLEMQWEGEKRIPRNMAPITLQDDQGRYFILSSGHDGDQFTSQRPNTLVFGSRSTLPVDGSSPLTLRLDWVNMAATGQGSITVDVGPNPAPGQEWTLDQIVETGGFDVHFTQARIKEAPEGGFTLEFDIEAPAEVLEVRLDLENVRAYSAEGGIDTARGVMVYRVTPEELPAGPLTFRIPEVVYEVRGPWEITWQPERVSAALPTPTSAPTRLADPLPTLEPDQPLLAEAQSLLSKAPLITGPGWVHESVQVEQVPSSALNTGGQPEQSSQMVVESWYLLDEQGYALTTIYIRKTPDGEVLSADIQNGPYSYSFPEGRGGIGDEIYLGRPPSYADPLSLHNGVAAQGGEISAEDTSVDGKPCRNFTATQIYDPPMSFWGEPGPVLAMINSICIEPSTGAVLQTQYRSKYVDGTETIKATTRFMVLEKVEKPSEEAQRFLDSVVMP